MNKIMIAAVIAAMTLSLAACGGNDNSDTSKAEPAKTTAADTESTAEEEVSSEDETSSAADESSEAEEEPTPAEDSSAADDSSEAEEDPEGTVTVAAGNFSFKYNENDWDALTSEGLGAKLTHKLNDDEIDYYSYQIVMNIEAENDLDVVKDGVISMYNGIAVFEEATEGELNGLPVTKVHGEMLGDGSAQKADIDLLLCQPEGEADVLVARYTSISINGDPHEKSEEDMDAVLNSVSWNKAE